MEPAVQSLTRLLERARRLHEKGADAHRLTVRADPLRVRVLDDGEILADHPRSYDRKAQIGNPAHIEALVLRKRQAWQHRGIDHLARAAPASRDLLIRAADRGANLGTISICTPPAGLGIG